ncbi:hypothetical protein ACN38_g11830 [Penicillium nordicum]|uniref:Uncharacterized protein n=1 Tax=Penicillium nordicum TaxID=229535 RepID=A0A0M8NZJ8_9EURO|nr:hypothetical protein ACN38_g11830 [Penicillium nordicum]
MTARTLLPCEIPIPTILLYSGNVFHYRVATSRAKRPTPGPPPGVGAPRQTQNSQQTQNLEIKYLLYGLLIQKIISLF